MKASELKKGILIQKIYDAIQLANDNGLSSIHYPDTVHISDEVKNKLKKEGFGIVEIHSPPADKGTDIWW